MDFSDAPVPSAAQVELLLRQLYQPTNKPGEIEALQTQLQFFQHACGWEQADELLESNDQNVRFFAALTFTVKINQSGSSLEEDDLEALLKKLLSWLIRLVERGESLLVLRKLCSTLVTYFVLPNTNWVLCIRHALCCLHSNQVVDESTISGFPVTTELLISANAKQRSIILLLSTILAEDAIRIDHLSQKFDYCHKRVAANIDDSIAVMSSAFNLLITQNGEDQADVLQCYLSWVTYVGAEFTESTEQMRHLRNLLTPAMECLIREQTFESAAQFFIDLFTGNDLNLDKEEVNELCRFLTSSWTMNHVTKIERGETDEDSNLIAELVLSFGQAIGKHLVESPQSFEAVLDIMQRLTSAQTYESIDQNFSNAVVDFWESYTTNSPGSDSEDPKKQLSFQFVKSNWLRAIEALTSAAALPLESKGELKEIQSDDAFAEFRSRVQGAVQGSYLEFDISILEKLISMVIQLDGHLQGRSLANLLEQERINAVNRVKGFQSVLGRLEFILYCISGLSDSMEHQSGLRTTEDELLGRLFQSNTYSSLTNFDVPCPEKLRKRAISIIGEQDDFFGSRPTQLLAAFDILFRALDYPGLHHASARAIYKLAENNRKSLTPKVDDFLRAAERLLYSTLIDATAKEYIVGSVAGIVQALPVTENRYIALMRICEAIQKSIDAKLIQDPHAKDTQEERQTHALEALGYLKALGKAFRAPDNELISIDDDEDNEDTGAEIPQALTEIQFRLVQFIDLILGPHREDGPLLMAACDVLRTGYRELQPGPFTFDAQVTADLITATPFSNPSLDAAILAAASFLNSQTSKQYSSSNAVLRLLRFVCNIAENIGTPDVDPDLSYACIEFLSCMSQGHVERLKQVPPEYVSLLLSFSIKCIAGANVAPKRSASQLWRVLLDTFNRSAENRDFLGTIIVAVGSSLAHAFVQCFGGNAARSELFWLTEPFRKMVFTQPLSKGWVEQALFAPTFPSSRISETDKRRFLSQIFHLRGDKRTQEVVKDFWLACRGTPAGYG